MRGVDAVLQYIKDVDILRLLPESAEDEVTQQVDKNFSSEVLIVLSSLLSADTPPSIHAYLLLGKR